MCEFFSSVCAREACVCFAALSASVSRCSHLHQSAKKALKALSYIVYIPIGAWTWWASGAAVVSGEHGKQMFLVPPTQMFSKFGSWGLWRSMPYTLSQAVQELFWSVAGCVLLQQEGHYHQGVIYHEVKLSTWGFAAEQCFVTR